MPLAEALRYLRGDQYPPLYFVLLRSWTRLFSDSPESVRWSSIFTSLVAAVIALALGRRVLGRAVGGAVCATLFMLSPAIFVFSLEVRAYILSVGLLMLATYFWFDLRDEQRSTRIRAVAFALACTASFYTHYLTAIPIAVLLGFLVFEGARARSRVLLAVGVTVALASPLLATIPRPGRGQLPGAARTGCSPRSNPESLNYGPPAQATLATRIQGLVVAEASLLGVYPAQEHHCTCGAGHAPSGLLGSLQSGWPYEATD